MTRPAMQITSRATELARLVQLKTSLEEVLPLAMTERRILLLLLAWYEPIGIPEVRAAVRSLSCSKHYDKLHRLIHGRVAFVELRELESHGLLRRIKEGARVYYRLLPSAKRRLKPVFNDQSGPERMTSST